MNVESLRSYCLTLPSATEDMPFGDEHLVFRVFGKIFACLSLTGDDIVALKCDADYAMELRASSPFVEPAFHWNKKYWNQICISGGADTDFILSLVRHSYSQVVAKFPAKMRNAHPELTEIN
ncbi:MAG: MmcQ/YjbR family DNA-binding protein [Bacteroidales bacterium]|nr:MmcQ/YjbR family DNA-binding protein [Bacteroidales bacterium]